MCLLNLKSGGKLITMYELHENISTYNMNVFVLKKECNPEEVQQMLDNQVNTFPSSGLMRGSQYRAKFGKQYIHISKSKLYLYH